MCSRIIRLYLNCSFEGFNRLVKLLDLSKTGSLVVEGHKLILVVLQVDSVSANRVIEIFDGLFEALHLGEHFSSLVVVLSSRSLILAQTDCLFIEFVCILPLLEHLLTLSLLVKIVWVLWVVQIGLLEIA